jgi:hypothetical protein
MNRRTTQSVFLQRSSYRQRRLRDGAKLVPFLGVILLAIPLAWSSDEVGEKVGASGWLYVFGVWVVLIVLTAILSSRLRYEATGSDTDSTER